MIVLVLSVHSGKCTELHEGKYKFMKESLTTWSRFEIKYVINETTAAAVEEFIKPYVKEDHFCAIQPDGLYTISSLYLDSHALKLCHESLDGKASRFKLRIRTYSDIHETPVFFEVKRRINSVIVKSRGKTKRDDFSRLINGSLKTSGTDPVNQSALNQFFLYRDSINARGVVKIKYRRKAYEGLDDERVRITFDRKICCNVTNKWDIKVGGLGWVPVQTNKVVLEIKFTGQFPPWVARMVNYLGLRQQSLSKYTTSVQQSSLLRYCAPILY